MNSQGHDHNDGPSSVQSSSDVDVETLILSTKNIQALRTLFNVTQQLGEWLKESWALVLQTLGDLDHALSKPRTTTRNAMTMRYATVNGSSNLDQAKIELEILALSLDQLFRSTSSMSEGSLKQLVAELVGVSMEETKRFIKAESPKEESTVGKMRRRERKGRKACS